MDAWVDMALLLTQLQQILQLNYKTTIFQNHQKIKLYGSPKTKKLKESHSSRWVERVDSERQRSGMGGPTPTYGG